MIRSPYAAGFTLIEVIGAFFMMAVILSFVTGIFIENGRQRSAATELMRVHTTSAAVLDLIAQDLEGAVYLTRPEARAPRDHPWLFLGERNGPLGSTFLRFATQNVSRGSLSEHSSTWVEVVYFLIEDEPDEDVSEDRFTLWRWRSTRPPSDPTSQDPDPEDPRSARVVEGVADFGVVFVDAEGATVDDWDSTFSPTDTPIPIAAEISLSLFRDAREGETEAQEIQIPGRPHVRHVSIPMNRPIDVDALIALAQDGDTGPSCSTVDDCLALGDDEWFIALLDSGCGGDDELCSSLEASGATCWSDIVQDWPNVANQAEPSCETLP
jgi:type II secretory pathway component PulJ